MVYVVSMSGKPLMPTERYGKVRKLLKAGKAKVIRRTPFTIQLLYETTEYVQPVTLGVDPGYEVVGLSAVTDEKELFCAEAQVRTDVPRLMSKRRQYRRSRRSRKTRYRKPRFSNRRSSKPTGWLAPSIENKIQTHIKLIRMVCCILPVSNIRIEVAQFDIQKLRNPDIAGTGYQQGDQSGFWNVREYVLWRDAHICQHCMGKSGDVVLEVHHLESRMTGSDRPGNLITLCRSCHRQYHDVGFVLPKPAASFRPAAHISVMRWRLYGQVKDLGVPVNMVYGYQTKHRRSSLGIPKSHGNDAFVIAGGNSHLRSSEQFHFMQVRKQNRKLYRGSRNHIRNQASRYVYGFCRWDKVRYSGGEYLIRGRRASGYFSLSDIHGKPCVVDGRKLDSVKYSNLTLLERSKTLIGRRNAAFLPAHRAGFPAAN